MGGLDGCNQETITLRFVRGRCRRWLTRGWPRGIPGMGPHAVAAPCGSSEKVWPPCSFFNKEPSKPTVWLPCPGTKEATSTARQRQHPRPSRQPPTMGVYVACVPVRRTCSCSCRLLQRGQHDAACLLVSCLLVLVLHACSCLCRILPRGTWPAHPQPMGLMALTHRGKTATWVLPSTVLPGWVSGPRG